MTCAEAKSYLEEFIPLIKNIKDDRKIVIAPPFTAISTFSDHSDFDYVDISSVANKAKKDDRIDTKDFDSYTTEQIITKCCQQLGITTANKSIYNQSELLLNNLNNRDRQLIAEALDLNESSNTLS